VSRRRARRRAAAATVGRSATIALIALVFASIAAGVRADTLDAKPRRAAASLSGYEHNLLHVVNATRADWGRAPLAVSAGLTSAAELHTARMLRRGFFEHEAPGEGAFWHRIERFYPSRSFSYWAVGENLAYGSPTLEPDEAVHEWLASPAHRRSLLSKTWREVGIAAVHVESAPGEYENQAATVITLDFGVRRG
jgi:uncharacterized protein YkwD